MAKPAILAEPVVQPDFMPQFGRRIRANTGKSLSDAATAQPMRMRRRTMGSRSG